MATSEPSDAAHTPIGVVRCRIDGVEVDPLLNRIGAEQVDRKSMDVLQVLVSAAPEPVSVQALLGAVWGDVVVGDNVVHQAIAHLRKAFREDAHSARVIATIPRRGYRVVAAIERPAEPAASVEAPTSTPPVLENSPSELRRARTGAHTARTWVVGSLLAIGGTAAGWLLLAVLQTPASSEGPQGPRRVAVLELRDLSPEHRLDWLAGGISQELRHQIGALPGFEVLSRFQVTVPSDDLRSLDVDLIVDGVVREADDLVRVTIDVTEADRATQLWSLSFDGRSGDPWELQQQIAQNIVRTFGIVTPTQAIGPVRREAYAAYLKYVRDRWGGNSDDELYWLEQTLALDPEWVGGWEELSYQYLRRASWWGDPALLQRARENLDVALRTQGPQARYEDSWVGAQITAWFDGDLDTAEARMRAMAPNGSAHYAQLMLASGLAEEASTYLRHAVAQNRHDVGAWDYLAMARATLGDVPGTLEAARVCRRLSPPDSYNGSYGLAWALPRSDLNEAERLLAEADASLARARPDSEQHQRIAAFRSALSLQIAMARGDRAAALAIVDGHAASRAIPGEFTAGMLYLALGSPKAEALLERASQGPFLQRFHWIWIQTFIGVELQEHPAIRRLKDAMGFTHAWRLEMCRRAATFPKDSHIGCDPERYRLPDA